MGLLLIFIGFLFTLNPMLALLDIFPDFIGYSLIFLGVNKLGMISPEMLDSTGYFKWAAIVSLARFGTFLGSGTFDETMVLCMTMVFAVLEFGLMLMAMPLLSDGLTYLGIRYSGGEEEDNTLRTVGIVFFAARGFLSVLPELGALTLNTDPAGDIVGETATVDWSEFSTSLTIANVAITLVFAAFFLSVLIKRIGSSVRNKEFTDALEQAYKEKRVSDPAPFIRRRLMFAFSILALACFFIIDFTADGKNFLPDFVFGLLSLLSVWLMSPYTNKSMKAYVTGAGYTVISIISYVYYTVFVNDHYNMVFDRLLIMFPHKYYLAIAITLIEGAALVTYIRYLLPVLSDVAENHVGLPVTDEFVNTKRQNEESVRSIKNKLKIYFFASIPLAISGVFFVATLHGFPAYWMIHAVVNIAAFVFFRHIISTFTLEINMRYEKPGE